MHYDEGERGDGGSGGGDGSSGSGNIRNHDENSGAVLVEAARSSGSSSRRVRFHVWLPLAPVSKPGAPLLLAGTMRLHAGPGGRPEEEGKDEGDEESRSYCGSAEGLGVRQPCFVDSDGAALSTDPPAAARAQGAARRTATRANFLADCARRRREDNEAGRARAAGWVGPFGGHCGWFHTAGMMPGGVVAFASDAVLHGTPLPEELPGVVGQPAAVPQGGIAAIRVALAAGCFGEEGGG